MNRYFLYDVFKPSCERQGIKVLPDDMRFIDKCLGNIPVERHDPLLKRYQQIWITAMRERPKSISSMNLGRKRANQYLGDMCGTK